MFPLRFFEGVLAIYNMPASLGCLGVDKPNMFPNFLLKIEHTSLLHFTLPGKGQIAIHFSVTYNLTEFSYAAILMLLKNEKRPSARLWVSSHFRPLKPAISPP